MADVVALVGEVILLKAPHHHLLLVLSDLAAMMMSPAILVHDQRALVADVEPVAEDVVPAIETG